MSKFLTLFYSVAVAFLCFLPNGTLYGAEPIFDIRQYGAVDDGTTLNTEAIQKAIDACTEAGGGRVFIPNGTFLTGSILLKDNVSLYLAPSAVLLGSPEFKDYRWSLVGARNASNVGIEGRGTINGNGDHKNFWSEEKYDGLRGRQHMIQFVNCKHVRLRDFRAINAMCWCVVATNCDFVSIDGLYVRAKVNANNDGIDITDCHDTRISNCIIDCEDDGLCVKSTSDRMVKRLTITNCQIKSECNALKFGTQSVGGFEDVTISNCVITDTRLSGIALEVVDGGRMDRITIDNITMNNVNGTILIKLGLRRGEKPVLRNVSISNVIADGLGAYKPSEDAHFGDDVKDTRVGVSIMGQPGFPLENITLRNMTLRFAGDCEEKDAKIDDFTDNRPKGYPEYTNFGITPAYGINCRHVDGLRLENITLSTAKPDARAAIHLQDVQAVRLDSPGLCVSEQAPASVRIKDSNNVIVSGCKSQSNTVPFISFEGTVRDVSLLNNDFSALATPFLYGEEVSRDEIKSSGNIH